MDGKVRQTVLATVGRLDRLNESGAVDRFGLEAARFMILSAAKENNGADPGVIVQSLGPALPRSSSSTSGGSRAFRS